MEAFKCQQRHLITISVMVMAIVILFTPIYGQITTPCTTSMITSFTPCINFITGSTGNGTSPTADCCRSVRSLISGSMDCACLLVTANVPIQLPINRTLAISLPRACKISGVPLQCKASVAPIPPAGTVPLGPAPSPSPTASLVPESISPAESPESDTTSVTPAPETSPVGSETPTLNPRSRPVLTPSSAEMLFHISSPCILFVLGIMVFNFYYV